MVAGTTIFIVRRPEIVSNEETHMKENLSLFLELIIGVCISETMSLERL